jgi:hypothetical protein
MFAHSFMVFAIDSLRNLGFYSAMMRLGESKENRLPISCVTSVASVTLRDAERPSVSIIATFNGKDTNYRGQCKIIVDLFLTTEGGRE